MSGLLYLVASPGIEPGSGASETLILSIVLRGRIGRKGNIKCLCVETVLT